MENTLIRPEGIRSCPLCSQGAEDPGKLLERLKTGSEQVFGLFSSAVAGHRSEEFTGKVAQASRTAERLTCYAQSGSKEFVKVVADRVASILSSVYDHVKKESCGNVSVTTSLLDLGEHLVALHEVAVRRYRDNVIV